jgi:hypothetical protein
VSATFVLRMVFLYLFVDLSRENYSRRLLCVAKVSDDDEGGSRSFCRIRTRFRMECGPSTIETMTCIPYIEYMPAHDPAERVRNADASIVLRNVNLFVRSVKELP